MAERKRLLDELASSGETMVSGDYKPGATRFKGELVGVTVAQR